MEMGFRALDVSTLHNYAVTMTNLSRASGWQSIIHFTEQTEWAEKGQLILRITASDLSSYLFRNNQLCLASAFRV